MPERAARRGGRQPRAGAIGQSRPLRQGTGPAAAPSARRPAVWSLELRPCTWIAADVVPRALPQLGYPPPEVDDAAPAGTVIVCGR